MNTFCLKISLVFLLAVCSALSLIGQMEIRTGLELTPYHFPQEGVPRGELKGPFSFRSKIIEGTVRQYWLFIPAQYEASKPASVLVFQDGYRATNPEGSIRAPQVLENLIAKGEIPVTIGIFISPGNLSEEYPTDLGSRNPNNRAAEYDAMNNRYARFIVEEMLPEVSKQYNLTNDPEQRAIGGTSSGAIASFTVAWYYPDMFRKVYSSIGSYVSIGFRPDETPIKLGGQDYPALIRREAIRPMRIYVQDGINDLSNRWGDWFLANQQMVSAMKYANENADQNKDTGPRYQFKAVWTDGEHNDKHPGALLPEGLKWLWGEE
ncbi:MAG: alpha/beta hydrolase-fold protein [Bacteroidia bacterium]|nr:alpha/beta hydrolase-fold protein [Bacteroidia bacterium]